MGSLGVPAWFHLHSWEHVCRSPWDVLSPHMPFVHPRGSSRKLMSQEDPRDGAMHGPMSMTVQR